MKRFLLALCLLALTLPAGATNIRKQSVKQAFVKLHACPSTGRHQLPCPGYVIDDDVALDCGGQDAVANKRWQTIAAAKAKDRWERNGPACRHRTHGVKPKAA